MSTRGCETPHGWTRCSGQARQASSCRGQRTATALAQLGSLALLLPEPPGTFPLEQVPHPAHSRGSTASSSTRGSFPHPPELPAVTSRCPVAVRAGRSAPPSRGPQFRGRKTKCAESGALCSPAPPAQTATTSPGSGWCPGGNSLCWELCHPGRTSAQPHAPHPYRSHRRRRPGSPGSPAEAGGWQVGPW